MAYDLVNRSVVRHFATRESYSWAFQGPWAGQVKYLSTDVNELREVAGGKNGSFPLDLRNDHIVWTLPADLATVGAGQMLTATVNGTAWFAFRTTNLGGPNPGDVTEISKDGDLNVLIQVW